METTGNEKTKKTSMCLSESTQVALKKLVHEHKLRNQDEAIKFLINAAAFTQVSPEAENRKQAVYEIQDLFRRIMVKITENFDLMADIKADAEREIADKEFDYKRIIEALKEELREKEIRIKALEDSLDRVGGKCKEPASDNVGANCKSSAA